MMNMKNKESRTTSSQHLRKDSWYLNSLKYVQSTYGHSFIKYSQLGLAIAVCMTSWQANAAILNDNSERRIQVSQVNNQAYVVPARPNNRALNSNAFGTASGDSMQSLIEQKNRQYNFDAELSIEENKRVITSRGLPTYNTQYGNQYSGNSVADFNIWLNSNRFRAQEVANYQRYLSSQVGAQNVPPLEQLLTTARSWESCGYEPFQLPPQELWSNVVPTLRLYSMLKNQGILPPSTEIRSVYRSPGLNDCAGGADTSKHMTAGAIDIWVPEYETDSWQLSRMQDSLCDFWQYQGQSIEFGLGLYSTGAVHLDTQGYRKWGFNNVSSSSACRY